MGGSAQEYLEQSGVPHACLLTSIFFENFLEGMGPRKQEDGSAAFSTNLGTAPHAWHSVIDIGGSAAGSSTLGLLCQQCSAALQGLCGIHIIVSAFQLCMHPQRLALPKHLLEYILGHCAEILADPTKYDGKTIPVNSGYITNDECAKVYSAVTGEEVR